MSLPLGWKFIQAAKAAQVEEILSLLKHNPSLDVNWEDYHGWTAFHYACIGNHVEVVKLLLGFPHLNVNGRTKDGRTPLIWCCELNRVAILQLLLKDARVDFTYSDTYGWTPLITASCYGCDPVIEWLIASGRDLGDVVNSTGRTTGNEECTAIEVARREKKTKVVALLERFIANPAQTRCELRGKLGLLDEMSAEIFALVVFLCDDLLQFKPVPVLAPLASTNPAAATAAIAAITGPLQFFGIAIQLPMELQIILCRRAVGSMKQNIFHKDSEAAFKSLARISIVVTAPAPTLASTPAPAVPWITRVASEVRGGCIIG